MLETQLATLAWNDLSRRAPVQTELLKQLTQLGLAHDLAGELVAQLPARLELVRSASPGARADCTTHRNHRRALDRTAAASSRWSAPTGVGKTTLIAKLAARWVLRHGPRDIALISTDSVRIGAQEQIHTLGRLLGVPAYAVDGAGELPVLEHLSRATSRADRHRGLEPARSATRATNCDCSSSASERMETALVLSAAAQAGAIEEAIERFAAAQPGELRADQARRSHQPRRRALRTDPLAAAARLRQRRPARTRRSEPGARASADRARRRVVAQGGRHCG